MIKIVYNLCKIVKKSSVWALSFITVIFTFVPESVFAYFPIKNDNVISKFLSLLVEIDINTISIIMNKMLSFILIWLFISLVYGLCLKCRKSVTIKGKGYIIEVKYGDLLKMPANCKRVINFDECFTTSVGQMPGDIKPDSICGQYLKQKNDSELKLSMNELISKSGIKPEKKKSEYQGKDRYKSGTIVPNGDDLLMAFAMLDSDGRGRFLSIKEYVDCLFYMWKEIDKYYGQKDVCVPVLGSGITRFEDGSDRILSQQELLDIMIHSYKLYSHKIKRPNKLMIICKRKDDFSLNSIQFV